MTEQLQLRGGTNAENNAFTGAPREVTVDTTFNQLRVHDGVNQGGTVVGGALGMLFKGEVGPGDWNTIAPSNPEVGDAWLVVGTITNFPGAPPDPTTGELVVYSSTGWINVGSELVGPPGPEGPGGTAATVDVGVTVTKEPGTDATVVNSGATTNAVFDFGIPRGDKGDTGPQGPPGIPGDSVLHFKGQVATVGDLPSSGNQNGDAYYVTDEDKYYIWDGSTWIAAGGGTGVTPDLAQVLAEGNTDLTEGMYVKYVNAPNFVSTDTEDANRQWSVGQNTTWAAKVTDSTYAAADPAIVRGGFQWDGAAKAQSLTVGESIMNDDPFYTISTSTIKGSAPSVDQDAVSIELGCYNGSPGPNTNYDTNISIHSDGDAQVTGTWDFCEGLNTSSNYDDVNYQNRTTVIGSSIYILDKPTPFGHALPAAHVIAYEQKDADDNVAYSWYIGRYGNCKFTTYDLESLPTLP